jgi:hypothetical protein
MTAFMSSGGKGIKAGESSATQGSLVCSFEGYDTFFFPRPLAEVLRLDGSESSWEKVTSMSVARLGIGVAGFRGRIWAVGGMAAEEERGGLRISRVTEVFDPETNT